MAIGNITKVYNEEQKFPEMNAYCISKLYADWTTDGAKTAHSEALTEENVLTVFDEMMKDMDNKRVPSRKNPVCNTGCQNAHQQCEADLQNR